MPRRIWRSPRSSVTSSPTGSVSFPEAGPFGLASSRGARRTRDNLKVDIYPSLEFGTRVDAVVVTDEAARRQGVSVVFTGRDGGVSEGPYESLNLSTATGDSEEAVRTNRSRAASALGVDALSFAKQVHGADVLDCDGASEGVREGDALVTTRADNGVGVLTADCVPVLVLAESGVAAIHAGWRGIVAGVVPAALARMDAPLAAWVGPSIHACCYEVGPDVTSAFEELALPVADPWHVDPSAAVCAQLQRAGIDRIAASSLCTSCDGRFFSHRRDRVTGRQGGFIALL